jgi:MFS family permease
VNKINKISVSLSLGALCYAFWIVCFLLPSLYHQQEDKENLPWYLNKSFIKTLLIVTAAINGAGAGILWVSQGKYISECATDATKGFYMGYFWAFFMSSQITGNIIAALMLGGGNKSTLLFIVFACFAVFGSLLFCFLTKAQKQASTERRSQI